MSDNNSETKTPIDYSRGAPIEPRIRTNSTYSDRWGASGMPGGGTREGIAELLGGNETTAPQLWDAVGYPGDEHLSFRTWYHRYDRDSLAKAIIDRPADSTWQDAPFVVDHGDDGDSFGAGDVGPGADGFGGERTGSPNNTDFERAVSRLLTGDTLRRRPTHRFRIADRMASLGRFSVLVLGFADGKDMKKPLEGIEDFEAPPEPSNIDDADDSGIQTINAEETVFNGLSGLNYISVFAEDRVDIESVNQDMTSHRFKLPETYRIQVEGADEAGREYDAATANETDIEEVHWTRVIHIPEGEGEDDLLGTSGLRAVINDLLNADKIRAGSAEGYWRAGFQGVQVKPPTNAGGAQPKAGFSDLKGGGELAQRIQRYTDNYQRFLATNAELEPIDVNVVSPEPHWTLPIQSICSEKRIPQSYLLGNETGERATEQDQQFWDREIANRRNNFATPVIFEPLIDRLVYAGVLPVPAGGVKGYDTGWKSLHQPSDQAKADEAKTWAEAANAATGGDPSLIFSDAELRVKLGAPPKYGSAVQLSEEEQREEQTRKRAMNQMDESDPEIQAAAEEMGVDGAAAALAADGGTDDE